MSTRIFSDISPEIQFAAIFRRYVWLVYYSDSYDSIIDEQSYENVFFAQKYSALRSCAVTIDTSVRFKIMRGTKMSGYLVKDTICPSQDAWIAEAKKDPSAENIGMYLTHTGIVRKSAKAKVRSGAEGTEPVTGMHFSYDEAKVEAAIAEALEMPGIYYIRVWLNSGELVLGDTIMQVLIGGDIRPRVIDGLQALVGKIKNECVVEEEKY